MRSFIVGTAGHIDHGKSALVRALTGTDPDRLKEEKQRGITIDLGFAHAALAEDVVASFIDVPGHERFVRNMLAGAFGIDAVLLVVAADESVMPQTREHFQICRLLGIPRGLVALSRCDLADPETQSLAELEVRDLVRGSFLEGRPIVRVSARDGQGLDELRAALLSLAREAPPRAVGGLLRLPVDRVFTLRGFGTVATGTVVGGALETGEEVEVLPAGRRARVRGLQVHGETVTRVAAGTRAAVNLSGVEVADLARGDVLAHVGMLRSTSMLDVEVTLLTGGSSSGSSGSGGWSAKALRDLARVRVHLASAEVLARVRVLDGPAIEPGQPSLAQLRLERPAVAGRGDLLVMRSYSPSLTIGGARVLDPLPPKRRRGSALPHLRALLAPDLAPGRVAARLVEAAGVSGLVASDLVARMVVPLSALEPELARESAVVMASREPAVYVSRSGLDKLCLTLLEALAHFHASEPLRPGMAREELRERIAFAIPAVVFEAALAALVRDGRVRVAAETLALSAHAVTLGPREQEAQAAIEAAARAAGLAGVETKQLGESIRVEPKVLERLVRLLLEAGTLRRVGEGMLVHREDLDQLKRRVRDRWPSGSPLAVPAFKDLTGLTRKHVIPLLEYLDRERVTKRVGAERTVL